MGSNALKEFHEVCDQGKINSGSQGFVERLNNSGLYNSELDVIKNMDLLIDEVRDWIKSKGDDFKQTKLLMEKMLEIRENDPKYFRKDKITPKALHEITQAVWCIGAIEDGMLTENADDVLSIIFAHDLGEDFFQSPEMIEEYLRENGIDDDEKIESFKQSFIAISKYTDEEGKENKPKDGPYFDKLREDVNALIAKLFDRAQNSMTYIGAFDDKKISEERARTALLLSEENIDDMCEKYPEHAELIFKMHKYLHKQRYVTRYHTAKDLGSLINDNNELIKRLPDKIFGNMPQGLHPIIVPANRVRVANPEVYGYPYENNTAIMHPPFLSGDISELTH